MAERGETNLQEAIRDGQTLRVLLNLLPIGVAIAKDSCCERVELNSVAARLLGVPANEMVAFSGPKSKSLQISARIGGKTIALSDLPICRAAKTGRPMHGVELELVRKDGVVSNLYVYASPILDDVGNVTGCIDVMIDVTEYKSLLQDRQLLSERFAVSLDTMPEPFGVFAAVRNDDGKITDFAIQYINLPGAETNRLPREEQIGKRLLELSPMLREAGWFEAFADLVQTGKPLHREFVFNVGGQRMYFECRGSRLGDGFVAQWRETTDRHRSEEALRENELRLRLLNETLEERVRERTAEANLRAEQLRDLALDLAESESRERKRFAQLLHDHFQQLVSAAKMRAGIIRRRAESDELKESVQQIEQLLVQALDASRNLATQLSPPVLHDAGLVPALESIVRSTERESGISIRFKGDPNAEPSNEKVRLMLFDATRELIQNVVQHSGAKTAVVMVAKESATNRIRIDVIDEGKGFNVHEAQLERDANKPFGLMGIQERIRYIKGDVKIASEPGKGTRIEISVPAELRQVQEAVSTATLIERTKEEVANQSAAESVDPTVNEPSAVRGIVTPLRIVVADDHRLFREGLTSLLSHETYLEIVGEASDGEQAVDLTRKLKPDVLICDISMPRRNGVEVTALLTQEQPNLKVLGLSMHEREDMANAMRSAGASAYLTKSGPSDLLLAILRTYVPVTPNT